MQSRLATVLATLVLAACAALPGAGLKPGVSTESEVRAALGKPAVELAEPGGGRSLAYPTGPMGTQTFMARLGPDGVLRSLDQVLAQEYFAQLRPGKTTGAEVLRIIGPPWRRMDFPNKRQVAWDYVFQDSWGYVVDYSVMLDERGIVAEMAYVRRESGRDGRR